MPIGLRFVSREIISGSWSHDQHRLQMRPPCLVNFQLNSKTPDSMNKNIRYFHLEAFWAESHRDHVYSSSNCFRAPTLDVSSKPRPDPGFLFKSMPLLLPPISRYVFKGFERTELLFWEPSSLRKSCSKVWVMRVRDLLVAKWLHGSISQAPPSLLAI